MAGLQPIQDLSLVRWLLRARDGGASGVLTVRPPLQDAVAVTLVGGRVRHIAPDLEVLAGAGDDPGALASALEVGRDMVADRIRTLCELRDGEFVFVEDAATAALNSAAGLPLEVDPAVAVLRSFDHPQCDAEQAKILAARWEERLRPGPHYAVRLPALAGAWPHGSLPGAIDRAQSITELAEGAPDALTLLRRVYAAVATGVAVLVDPTVEASAPPAAVAAAPPAVAPAIAELPWDADQDLVVTSTPLPMQVPDLAASTPAPSSVEQLVADAEREDDPWIGVSAYPDVAERVVRRDARVRSGRVEERRTRSGVSQLIRPESEDVGLNLDLVDEQRTSTAHLLSKPPSAQQPATPPPESAPQPSPAPAPEPAPEPATRRLSPPQQEASAPRVLTAPGAAPAPEPRVLTAPGAAPAPAPRVLTAPGAAPSPAPRAVLTTPPPNSVETVRGQTPPPPEGDGPAADDSAAAGAASSAAEVSDLDAERLAALNEWLDQALPHLESEELYKAFGVDEAVDRDDLVRKHRELVVQFHPDRFERFEMGDVSERLVVAWGKLNKAIVTLTDPRERVEYDIYIDRKRKGLPTDPEVVMRAESTYLDGERLLRAGRFTDALAKYDQAIALNGADPEFHVARSWTRVQVAAAAPGADGVAPPRLRDEARSACLAALKDIPRLDRGHYYLGMLAKMDGNAFEARTQFQKAVELNAHNVEAKRELRLLDMRGGTQGPAASASPPSGADASSEPTPEKGGGLFGRFRKS